MASGRRGDVIRAAPSRRLILASGVGCTDVLLSRLSRRRRGRRACWAALEPSASRPRYRRVRTAEIRSISTSPGREGPRKDTRPTDRPRRSGSRDGKPALCGLSPARAVIQPDDRPRHQHLRLRQPSRGLLHERRPGEGLGGFRRYSPSIVPPAWKSAPAGDPAAVVCVTTDRSLPRPPKYAYPPYSPDTPSPASL
jgi:hypothetical protein